MFGGADGQPDLTTRARVWALLLPVLLAEVFGFDFSSDGVVAVKVGLGILTLGAVWLFWRHAGRELLRRWREGRARA